MIPADLIRHPDMRAFAAALKENPFDADAMAVAADWLDEHGCDPKEAAHVRDAAERLRWMYREWKPFEERLRYIEVMELNYADTIPIKTTNRGCGQKTQARLARELFRELAIPHVSVTCATGSFCFWVNVEFPAPRLAEHVCFALGVDWPPLPTKALETWAESVIYQILARAFPNHDDRSDSMTDYYDDPWRVNPKGWNKYTPRKPRAPKPAA